MLDQPEILLSPLGLASTLSVSAILLINMWSFSKYSWERWLTEPLTPWYELVSQQNSWGRTSGWEQGWSYREGELKKKKMLGNLKQISLWFCWGPPQHSMKIALQAAVGVSPSAPSQAVEEMKRRSREGQGQEARAERGERVVSAAALHVTWMAPRTAAAGPGHR